MIKEQAFRIVDSANFKDGPTSEEATNELHSLYVSKFKEIVGEMTLTDEQIDEKLENDWDGLDAVSLIKFVIDHSQQELREKINEL